MCDVRPSKKNLSGEGNPGEKPSPGGALLRWKNLLPFGEGNPGEKPLPFRGGEGECFSPGIPPSKGRGFFPGIPLPEGQGGSSTAAAPRRGGFFPGIPLPKGECFSPEFCSPKGSLFFPGIPLPQRGDFPLGFPSPKGMGGSSTAAVPHLKLLPEGEGFFPWDSRPRRGGCFSPGFSSPRGRGLFHRSSAPPLKEIVVSPCPV